MTSIANMVDFFCDGVTTCSGGDMCKKYAPHGMVPATLLSYTMVFVFISHVYDYCWRPSWTVGWTGFSFIYFIGSCFQTLGFLLMCMKVNATRTVEGLSSHSLMLFATSLSCRLLSTCIYDGYLPVDKSGDYSVQAMDIASLACVIYLLYAVHKTYVHTYQEETDGINVMGIVAASAVSALFIHAELNRDPLFDMIYAFSLNVEIFQMLPQLHMLAKNGGLVEHSTAHYVVNTFISCCCRFAFWMWAIPGCKELIGGGFPFKLGFGGYYILITYSIEILIHLDFIYYYVRAKIQGKKNVYLPSVDEI